MEQGNCNGTDDCAIGFNPNSECQNTDCYCTEISHLIGANKKELFETIVDFTHSHYEMDATCTRVKVKTKNGIMNINFQNLVKHGVVFT